MCYESIRKQSNLTGHGPVIKLYVLVNMRYMYLFLTKERVSCIVRLGFEGKASDQRVGKIFYFDSSHLSFTSPRRSK